MSGRKEQSRVCVVCGKTDQQVVFLAGNKVVLVPPSKERHLAYVVRWINDPEVRHFLTAVMPMSEVAELKWLEGLSDRPNTVVLIIETTDGRPIGTIGLHGINWVHGTAVTGTLIGEKDCWGKGYGTDAKMALLQYAFETLNLRQIQSRVLGFNERSVRYSKRCGYREIARIPNQFYRAGRYWDEIILIVSKDEWLEAWKAYQTSKPNRLSKRT